MKHRAALGSAALLLLVAGTAAGCGGEDAAKADPPAKSSTASPLASPTPTTPREKAAADAQAAIDRYFTVLNEVGQNPKVPLSRLRTVATGTILLAQESQFRQWRKNGWRQTGDVRITDTRVESLSLDNSDPDSGRVPYAVVTICTDATDVDALDRSGKSVVSDSRPDQLTTRYSVANHSWKTAKRDGWRVSSAQDQEIGSCTL